MLNLSSLRVACSNCNLRSRACLRTFPEGSRERVEDLVSTRRRVKRGEALFRAWATA